MAWKEIAWLQIILDIAPGAIQRRSNYAYPVDILLLYKITNTHAKYIFKLAVSAALLLDWQYQCPLRRT